MAIRRRKRFRSHRLWLEAFALINLSGLSIDICLAHATNAFRDRGEYIPLILSILAPVVLLTGNLFHELRRRERYWRFSGYVVGWAAIITGIVGFMLHLKSRFFQDFTIESLVYTAPFAAPLAYTGIGLLLIMNRMVSPHSKEWARWVILLALGGFVGNFIFSLADHAQNAFYHWTEWIPVIASSLGVGFLLVLFMGKVSKKYLVLCAEIMGLQAGVGLLGFALHTTANLRAQGQSIFENIVYGAPPMAPLLFPNLAILTGIGLWVWAKALDRKKAPK